MIYYDRIRKHTFGSVNVKIDRKTSYILSDLEAMGPDAIELRLKELDREWDIDRVLMLNFSVQVFLQLLAARKNKKWLWGPLIQTPFLFLHSTYGWCPPMLWFRPLGFRTRQEIQSERDELIRLFLNKHTPLPSEFH
jgi:hypothetical protein